MDQFISFALQPEVFLVWTSLAKTLALLGIILGFVSYTVYAERKVCAEGKEHPGNNRNPRIPLCLGYHGLGKLNDHPDNRRDGCRRHRHRLPQPNLLRPQVVSALHSPALRPSA